MTSKRDSNERIFFIMADAEEKKKKTSAWVPSPA